MKLCILYSESLNTTEEKESELEEFIDYAKIIMRH
jgi:hypothetical protein